MTRKLLGVTAAFYIAFGLSLIRDTLRTFHIPGLSAVGRIVVLLGSSALFGVALTVAGVFSLLGTIYYENRRLRLFAAGLRAGSISALLLLQTMAVIFLSAYASLSGLVILIYLTILTIMTAPPPIPADLNLTLQLLQEERSHVLSDSSTTEGRDVAASAEEG